MLEVRPIDPSLRVLLRESSRRRQEALEEVRERIAGFVAMGLVVAIPLFGIGSGSEFSFVEESEAAEPSSGVVMLKPPPVNYEAVLTRLQTNELSPADIRTVQILLKGRGFDPGPIDGIAGKHTLSALNAYRQSLHLAPALSVNREAVAVLQDQ